MDDNNDAAARREARRKRILQNPEERLRRLKGLQQAETPESETFPVDHLPDSFPAVIFQGPPPEANYLHRKIIHAASESNNAQPAAPLFEVLRPGTSETDEDIAPELLANKVPQQSLGTLDRLIYLKLHVILLAVVVRLLLMFDQGYLFGNMVLAPFVWIELTLYLSGKGISEEGNQGGMIGAALILSGFGQSKVHSLLKSFCALQGLAYEGGIYLFVFLLSHAACLWIEPS